MIFISDYDGTLSHGSIQKGAISQQDLQAIARFRAAGHTFGIATGRALDYMRADLARFDLNPDFIIGANGGIALMDGKEHRYSVFTPEALTAFALELQALPGMRMVFCDAYTYTTPIFLDDLTPAALAAHIQALPHPQALLVVENNGEMGTHALYHWLQQHYPNYEHHFNHFEPISVDITQLGTSKASAITHLLVEEHGIHPSRIHVIGDSLNDQGMLQAFNGYLMQNSHPDLLKLGLPRFPTVAACLDHLLKSA